MKKIMIMIMGIFIAVCFSNNVFAAGVWSQSSAGSEVGVTDPTGGGPGIAYTPSPGTLMTGATAETAFSLAGFNHKSDADGIMYILISGDSNIYQKAQAATDDGTMPSITFGTTGSAPSGYSTK